MAANPARVILGMMLWRAWALCRVFSGTQGWWAVNLGACGVESDHGEGQSVEWSDRR